MDDYSSPQAPYNSFGAPPPPPPRVALKHGKNIIWWPTDEGSLASRSIGKVNIDCRLRLSESKWGVLEGSQPAGILYVDLTFDQPAHCRLSSATVLISLEEYDEEEVVGEDIDIIEDDRGKKKDGEVVTLSRLRVCEFGPKLLTGEPTTLKRRTEYSFTPEVNAGMGGVGGVGVKRQNSINYISRWVLKGNTLAPADKKRKTPGIVYRTLKWELTENELAYQPEQRSVVHTAFAFEHELKRFYIKVEISGKLSDAIDRLKHRVFPPRLKKNQGTLFTLVDLGAEDKIRKENLDNLARKLEEQMREKNLISLATKHMMDNVSNSEQKDADSSAPSATGGVDLADLAKATEVFAPSFMKECHKTGGGGGGGGGGGHGSFLHPGIYSTPAPSYISMASTLAPSQTGDIRFEVPPVPPPAATNDPLLKSQIPDKDSKGQPRKEEEIKTTAKDTVAEDTKPATIPPNPKIKEEEESCSPSDKDCEEEQEDLKLRKAEEKAIKVIAAELQFIEILIMLRAWAVATFLAMFIRNQQAEKRKAGKESRVPL